jgi:hypothetical protein
MLWHGIFVALIVLALNKLFEGSVTGFIRMLAMEEGWYDQRRVVQIEFIAVVALVCLLVVGVLLLLARHAPAATQIALVGTMMLLALGLVRDASLHQIDHLMGQRIIGLKVNWIFELGGLGLVLLASKWRGRRRQKDRPKCPVKS